MSVWAFERLADPRFGMMAVRFRAFFGHFEFHSAAFLS
jgi:hypothetical protein